MFDLFHAVVGDALCWRRAGRSRSVARRYPASVRGLGVLALALLTLLAPVRCVAEEDELARAVDQTEAFVSQYCWSCHDETQAIADTDLESQPLHAIDWTAQPNERRLWEGVWKRIASGQMPPPDAERPSVDEYRSAVDSLAVILDAAADRTHEIPPTESLRRLTRTEYQNSVRDLLAVDVDVSQWLPKDESSNGFDNITVGELSPVLMSRYLTAAEQISRIAVGRRAGKIAGLTVRLPADLTQEQHLEGLPLGTRGGTNIRHTFAEPGVYELAIRLTRDRDEMIEGLHVPHEIDVLVDRVRRHRFRIEPPANGNDDTLIDSNLKTRLTLTAGPHDVAVTFVSQGDSLAEIKRQPFDAAYNRHRHPRPQPAIFQVSVVGPLATPATTDEDSANDSDAALSDEPTWTPSRQRLFASASSDHILGAPKNERAQQEQAREAATSILRPLVRRAYRREVTAADLQTPLSFFQQAFETSVVTADRATIVELEPQQYRDRFELGIERAIASILVNPNFLFRVEREHADDQRGLVAIDDFELASRLSFFLWSSLPDDELLDLAAAKQLQRDEVLRRQTTRMLADARSSSLVTNFASQWLYLRNLDAVAPDLREFPDFDENLRIAFRKETELLFEEVMRDDRSVLSLLRSDHTFLNERLARHYGIDDVRGSHFRRVELSPDAQRGGILRHGSILTVTSYATRTSPTIRGNWVLKNLVGTPPPPPPPDVPPLKRDNQVVAVTLREQLAIHRENEACATCHALIDPIGFALDRYDAVGRWRTFDDSLPIDTSGLLPDGTEVNGVDDLEASLLERPELFVGTMTEKLLTFGLGRGVDFRDASAIRKVVRQSRASDYSFSSLVQGVVSSEPFRFRSR